MTRTEYLSTQQLVEINKRVLKDIKVKKADSHRVANRKKLDEIVDEVRALDGDIYEKATSLLMGLRRKHAFDSGNRRTAYAATEIFLEANGEALKAKPDPTVLTGIREGFYPMEEVVEWLKGNGIKEFRRHRT